MATDRRRVLLVAAAAFALDLATKAAAVQFLASPLDLPGPLDLRLLRNRGVSFGMGANLPPAVVLLVTAGLVCWLALGVWRSYFGDSIGPALILGGAAANLVDRALGGSVVDMLDVGWWPTFNLADVFITSGVALLLLSLLLEGRQTAPIEEHSHD